MKTKHSFISRAAMTLLVALLTAATAWADNENVTYIDADGNTQTANATVLTGNEGSLGTEGQTKWYVVNSNISYSGTITTSGNVNIILADSKTMTVNNGINGNGNLTIYGQSGQSGILNATNTSGTYTICCNPGNFIINGGTVKANHNDYAIYIPQGTFNINRGTVDATSGGSSGKGILAKYVTINGGYVTTNANFGIYVENNWGNITISGGNVTANGNWGIYAKKGDITLGWSNASDRIYASQYYVSSGYTINIAEGKSLKDANSNYFSGNVSANDINNKTLQPATQADYIQYCLGTGNDGSAQHPYTISDAKGWNAFCLALEDNDTWNRFSGKTVKLANDISVTRMAGGSNHEFTGTFDGDGHTLTISISSDGNAAPFREIMGATIRNLKVSGTVSGHKHSAGLVSYARGADSSVENTIENCLVATDVSTIVDTDGDCYLGGIVGHGFNCKLTIRGCAFTGSLTSPHNYTGGLQGWSDGNTLILENDIFAASSVNAANVGFHPIAFHVNNATTTATVTNVYYTIAPTCTTASRIAAAGKQARSITAGQWVTVSHAGVANTYSASGITAYKATAQGTTFTPGLLYNNNVLYAGNGEAVSLTLAHQELEGYDFICYTATAGNLDGTTLTMPNENVTINADYICAAPFGLTATNLTSTQATLNWNGYQDSYNVRYRSAGTNDWQTIDNIAGTTTTLTGLSRKTTYEWQVQGLGGDGNGNSEWSATDTFTTDVSCPTPTELACTTTTLNSATLSWTENGAATAWIVAYKKAADTDFTEVPANTNPFTLNGLTASTTYTFKVKAVNSEEEMSEWSALFDFFTACGAITTFPWTEDFNDLTTAYSIPNCWDNSDGTTTNNQYKWCYTTSTSGNGATNGTSHDGSKCVRFNSYMNSNGKTNFLKTPVLDLPANTPMQLSFWYKNPAGGDFSVYISTDGGNTYITALATELTGQTSWTEHDPISLSGYAGQEVVIVFKGTSNFAYDDAYIYLDDVTVKTIPSCVAPTALNADNITTTSADLSWTSDAGTFTVYYKKSTDDTYTEVTDVTANPYTLEDLDATSSYQFYVVTNCSATDASEPSKVFTFSTGCIPITITESNTFSEGFEGYTGASFSATNGVVPVCWDSYATNSNHIAPHIIGSGSYHYVHDGNNALTFYGSGYCYAALPEFTNNLSELRISFWMQTESATNGELTLGYITDEDVNYNTFTAIETYARNKGSMVQHTTYLNNVPAAATHLVFRWFFSTQFSCCIDDVEVSLIPSCVGPTGLTATDIASTSATLSWTEHGSATAWVLQYGTNKNFTAGTYTEATVNTTPTTNLTGLTAESIYYARVKPECDIEGNNWSDVISFWPTATMEVTVNNGAGTISSCPFYGNYVNSDTKSQFIIPATALEEEVNPGSTLKRMYFYTSSTYPSVDWGDATFKVYMKEVDYETFASAAYEDWTTLTNVYSGSLSVSSNKMEVIFDNDYTYLGGNLLIGFQLDSSGTSNSTYWLYTSGGGNNCVYSYNNGSVYRNSYLPKVSFRFLQGEVACNKPKHLTVSGVTAHSATMSWESDTDAWQVMLNDNEENLIDVNENTTYTFTNLDPETDYTAKVRTNCGSGSYSEWSKAVSFTTEIACPAPSNLTISNLTTTSATLTWTELGEGTSWLICLDGDEENLIEVNETTYTFATIQSETVHTVKVKSDCSTEWSSVVTFEPTAKLTIGSGTGTSGYLPSYTNYNYSYTQQIYTVEEFGEAGVIESIDFYMTSDNAYTRNLNIYMVSTDKNAFENNSDWITVTDADKVFSGNVDFTGGAWTTITLDDAFIYDGTKNVAIIVDDNTGSKVNPTSFLTYTVSEYQSIYYYNDNNNYNPTGAPGNASNRTTYKNQIRLMKSPLGDCMKPTSLKATKVGPDFATLSWKENGAATEWVVAYKTNGNADFTVVTPATTDNPFNLTGLSNETEYTVKVHPACDENLWSREITFTTLADNPEPADVDVSTIKHNSAVVTWTGYSDSYNVSYRTVPTINTEATPLFSEDFEGGNALPAGWTSSASVGSNAWTVGTGVGIGNGNARNSAHGSTHNAKIEHANKGNQTYLITPEIDLSRQSDAFLKFWMVNEKWVSDINELGVYYRVNGGAWNELAYITEDHTNWTEQTIALTGLAANYQIGFMMYDRYGYNVGLDDIAIYPANVATWQTAGENLQSPTATITGLEPETDYQVKVQGVKNEAPSDWSPVATFTTMPEPVDIELANDATNNTSTIEENDGVYAKVTLSGRELYKDGYWNTLCLPFDIVLDGSPLDGAEARCLTEASISGTTLNLNFSEPVDELTAGTPYIIKWSSGTTLTGTELVFDGVMVYDTYNAYDNRVTGDARVRFIGTYDQKTVATEDRSILFVGDENTLYYPDGTGSGVTIGACRAYFKIGEDGAETRQLTAFNLNFGEEETQGIVSLSTDSKDLKDSDGWFTLDGKKLDKAPTRKGLYIRNGKKVIIP